MSKRIFSELPADYQKGCHFIEKQCNELLVAASISFEAIYWDDMDLIACYLYVRVEGKLSRVKFGKRALTHSNEPGMLQSILFRLRSLVNQLKDTQYNTKQ